MNPAPAVARTIPRTLPLLIATLSMMGPFSIDTYLPSFPELEHTLHATAVQVQQSLTAFLIPFAFMSLWHGALSDALGRRRVIIVALSILAAASVGCACAETIEMFWAFRVLQGLSAGVFVVGRAVVRDVYEGPAAQRVMAQVSVLFAIAPAIAPVLGGALHEWFGWRSVFVFLACFAGAVAAWSALSLPETHPPEQRHPLHAGRLARSYAATLTHRGFVASALASAFGFAALFLYVATAPALLLRHLHVRETQFFFLFGPVTFGMMLGGYLSGRLAGKLDATRTLAWGFGAMTLSANANVAFHSLHAAALPWTVIPLFFYAAGIAMSIPTLTLLGLDFFPRHRGLAASCQAFLLTAANALTAGVLAPIASESPLRLAISSAALLALGLLCLPFLRTARSHVPTEEHTVAADGAEL